MKNEKDFAALWREKMDAEPPTVEMELAGFSGIFRRLPISGWFKTGRVPQFLAHALLETRDDPNFTALKEREAKMTAEEFEQRTKFEREVVCAVIASPKIVTEDRPLEEGEISYAELAEKCPLVIDTIVAWTLAGSPDIPVKMKGGDETSIEEISNFREG